MVEDLGFSFRVRKSGEVAIARNGKVVTVLRGPAANRFLRQVDADDPQLAMARVTGNYKRGNEKRS
jgi:hypothetical protein